MEKQNFTNEVILSWLQYYAQNTDIDLEHVKMIDITKKNKNVIPTIEAHKTTLIFTNAGIDDIFYKLWLAGLGECEVWYNEGSDPSGEILHKPVKEMIDRGIYASAGMLIINPNARNTSKIGLSNEIFQRGSIRFVESEIRAVILNKMMLDPKDDIVVIGGASIAIEAAMIAVDGSITAVEYSKSDRNTLADNVEYFNLTNVNIVDHVDDETMKDLPVPSLVFMVASASLDQELSYFKNANPDVDFVVYTQDFKTAATLKDKFAEMGIYDVETIQVQVSRLDSKNLFKQHPATWIITARGEKR